MSSRTHGAATAKAGGDPHPDIVESVVVERKGVKVTVLRSRTWRDVVSGYRAPDYQLPRYPNGHAHKRQTARHRTANVAQVNAHYERRLKWLEERRLVQAMTRYNEDVPLGEYPLRMPE